MRFRIVTAMVILVFSMIFMGQEANAAWPWSTATPTATRFVTSTPVPSFTPTPRIRATPTATRFVTSTPVAVITQTRFVTSTPVPSFTPEPTNTPFLRTTVQPSVEKHFVVTAIPPQTASVYVSCTFCTSIYYSYPVPYDMRRGFTYSGSTISVPAGTSLYTKPVVGFGIVCMPESDRSDVSAGYNRIPDFFCSSK